MKKCKVCKTDLRAAKSWTEDRDGKTVRKINLVCFNKGCTAYKTIVETEEIEVHESEC